MGAEAPVSSLAAHLARAGVCSRRGARAILARRRVTVNGAIVAADVGSATVLLFRYIVRLLL
jgi:16S rRNA U516 pseudouridylate synthase RsuA-like enzyme